MPDTTTTETPLWDQTVATYGDPFATSPDLEHLRHPHPDQLALGDDGEDDG